MPRLMPGRILEIREFQTKVALVTRVTNCSIDGLLNAVARQILIGMNYNIMQICYANMLAMKSTFYNVLL